MNKHTRAYAMVKAAQKNKKERDRIHESEQKQELVRNWLKTVDVEASTSFNANQLIEKETEDEQPSQELSDIGTDDSVKDPDYKEPIDCCSSATSSDFTPG